MPTKTELIAQVNREFPTYYPSSVAYPTLVSVTVGDVSHEYGTEADLSARFLRADGTEYELRGAYFRNHHGSEIELRHADGEKEMLSFLFGEIFCGNATYSTGVERWKVLTE